MPHTPKSAVDLSEAFEAISSQISKTIGTLSLKDLHNRPNPDAWSIRQLLDHMVRSLKPVAKIMSKPRRLLTRSFGTPDSKSRAFDAIQAVYQSELADGAVAAGPFLPDDKIPDEDLIALWHSVVQDFGQQLSNWSEDDLDAYQVPHPLIGMLTMREMAMFSIHHCRHHFEEIRSIVGK